MIASSTVRAGRIRSALTPVRITAAALIGLVALALIGVGTHDGAAWVAAYLGLVVITAIVLRGGRREPGNWLGRRAARRFLVVLLAADCAGLAATPAPPPGQAPTSAPSGIAALLLTLVVLNVALGQATQRVAAAPDTSVDERQESLRNRAHRIAYSIFALTVGGTLLIADVASSASRSWLQSSLRGGGVVAVLELLFVLPAMVLACLSPSPGAPDLDEREQHRPAAGIRARVAAVLLAATLLIPLILSLAMVVVPTSTSAAAASDGARAPVSAAGATPTCREFIASTTVGVGISAVIPLHAAVCWDGRVASEQYGMNASDCNPNTVVLAFVTTVQCSRTTTLDGTLSFIYHADVASALLPFLHRQVTLQIAIDRNGHVERFP